MRALGLDPSNDGLRNMISLIDKDPASGGVDFNEFVNLMTTNMDRKTDKSIMEMFMLFDTDNTGKVTFKNVKAMAKELGENLTGDITFSLKTIPSVTQSSLLSGSITQKLKSLATDHRSCHYQMSASITVSVVFCP